MTTEKQADGRARILCLLKNANRRDNVRTALQQQVDLYFIDRLEERLEQYSCIISDDADILYSARLAKPTQILLVYPGDERKLTRHLHGKALQLSVSGEDDSLTQLGPLVGQMVTPDGLLYQYQQKIHVEQHNVDEILENISESLIWVDNKYRIRSYSKAGEEIFGYAEPDLLGTSIRRLLVANNRSAVTGLVNRASHLHGSSARVELEGRRKDGSVVSLDLAISRSAEKQFLWNFRDISYRKDADARLIQLANYDPLTGLANRALTHDFLGRSIGRCKRSGTYTALFFIALDHLNLVNDSLGYDVGDELLINVAQLLQQTLREEDLIARWGSNEFALILDGMQSPTDTRRVADLVLRKLTEPFTLADQDLFLSPRIGIATYPESGISVAGLIQAADTALFEAKQSDRNSYRFFTSKMQKKVEERTTIEHYLRKALERDEFRVCYQPKVSISLGGIIGFEALLRWHRTGWQDVSPAKYIPIAEECGLIASIGEWVLNTACGHLADWHRNVKGMRGSTVAVNVSALQLSDPQFCQQVEKALTRANLDARFLELELTESTVMENPTKGIRILNDIHDLGVTISIDDFGTGYSSLSYLKKLPIDCIKVDRSFVSDIGLNSSSESIVQAIIAMSHSLDMHVVAEGVESVEQLLFLQASECDLMQGFYFSKPLSTQSLLSMYLTQARPLGDQLNDFYAHSAKGNRAAH